MAERRKRLIMLQPNTPVFGQIDHARNARFLDVADTIGRQLARDAIWVDGRCSWLVWSKEPVGGALRNVYRAAALDLYQGVSGIAVFLAHLVRLTRDPLQRETLTGAVRQLTQQLAQAKPEAFGFYSGSIGAALALASIGRVMEDAAWEQRGLAELDRAARSAAIAQQLDLMSGCAGAIIALVRAASAFDQPDFVEHAKRFADGLLSTAQRDEFGLSWPAHAGEMRNLLGLSHGTAGIALALLELNQACPDTCYLETASAAIDYERRLFNAAQNNWPDFRTLPGYSSGQPGYPVAWCHGAAGIGLSRLRMLDLLPNDQRLLGELDAAIANTVRVLNMPMTPTNVDFSLCHGVCGNSEFLLQLGRRLGRADAVAAAQRAGEVGIELFHAPQMPWGCGVPDCGEAASLMTGIAGIGLHYLRLFDPLAAPCVLLGHFAAAERSAAQPSVANRTPPYLYRE